MNQFFEKGVSKFEYGTIWIKDPIHGRGEEPYRHKATNKEEIEVINKRLKNHAIEELTLFPDQFIKPMFDRDSYEAEIDTEKDIEYMKLVCGDDIEVKVAAREPRMKNGKMFYSKRYYVQNKRIRANQLCDFIRLCSDIPKDHFDLSKYGKGGQFFTLYNTMKHNREVVPPLVPENDPDANPLDYYATYVLESYPDYDLKWEIIQTFVAIKKAREAKVVYKEDDEEVVVGKSTEIDDIVEHLADKRADNYLDWYKPVMAIINYGTMLKLPKRHIELIIHTFSKRSIAFYEEDKVDKWITNNYDRLIHSTVEYKLGRNYLINVCLKEDDFKYWTEKYKCRGYDGVLKELNKECVKIRMNGKWLIFRTVDKNNSEPYYLFDKKGLQHYYENEEKFFFQYQCEKDGKVMIGWANIVSNPMYFKDTSMRCYDNIVYSPCYDGEMDKKYFNTWEGWNAMNYKKCVDYAKCEVFLNHLKEVWCNDDEVLYKWFLEYLSIIVRGGRTCVVPIVRGKQGCGKDCFMTDLLMNKIIGSKYCLPTNDPVNQIFGKFNSALLNKSLVVIAEGNYDMDKCYDMMKDVISNSKLSIEKKFENIVSATNYTNFLISTNKFDIIKGDKGMKNRRIIYIDCSLKYMKNKPYFDAFYKALNDEDAISAFYNFLIDEKMVKQVDINDLSYLQDTMPETKLGKDISTKNTPIVSQFLYEYFKIDKLNEYVNDKKTVRVKRSELYNDYKKYTEFNNYERLKTDLFSANLLNYHGIECKKNSEFYYIFNTTCLTAIKDAIEDLESEGKEMMNDCITHTNKSSWEDGE